jgi:hypothetical protein
MSRHLPSLRSGILSLFPRLGVPDGFVGFAGGPYELVFPENVTRLKKKATR